MKKNFIIMAVIAIVLGVSVMGYRHYATMQKQYETALSNLKAYESIVSDKYEDNRVLQLTVD